jgi:hypothetical protein
VATPVCLFCSAFFFCSAGPSWATFGLRADAAGDSGVHRCQQGAAEAAVLLLALDSASVFLKEVRILSQEPQRRPCST